MTETKNLTPDDAQTPSRVLGIVIPTARWSSYLAGLLDSLLKQTDSRWEAIIVDDSGRAAVRREVTVSLPDDKVSWLENTTNLGLPESWNAGLRVMQSRARYVAISVVHDDDLLDPDYVRETHHLMSTRQDIAVCHFRTKIISEHGERMISVQDSVKSLLSPYLWNRRHVSEGDKGLARILRNNFVFCPSMVFNTALLQKIEFNPQWRFVTDLHFVSECLLSGKRLMRSPRPMYIYRRHRQNMTAQLTDSTERFIEEVALYRSLERECLARGFVKSASAARKKTSIKRHILFRMVLAVVNADWQQLKKLRHRLQECGSA